MVRVVMVGADTQALRELATQLRVSGERLSLMQRQVGARLVSTTWDGRDADGFRDAWSRRHRADLARLAGQLREAAAAVAAQADEQDRASRAGGSAGESPTWLRAQVEADRQLARGWAGFTLGSAAAFLLRHAGPVLEGAKWADTLSSLPRAAVHLRMLRILNANRAALGLAGVSASRWITSVGGRVPVLGAGLALADVALNWHQKGIGDADTQGAIVLGSGSVISSVVAGPLGGLAWECGVLIGTGITNIPVGDGRNVGQALGSAGFDLAYGASGVDVPERSGEWYRTATPEQLAAHSEALAAASRESKRICERTQNPLLYASDLVTGGARRLGRLVGL